MPEGTVEVALRDFVRPAGFAAAAKRLESDRLLVLQGDEGIGKATSAIALLDRAATARPLISLAPVLTVGELAGYGFRSGRGYLIQDHTVDYGTGHGAIGLEAVARHLDTKNAFLIITRRASGPGDSLRYTASWQPPPPLELLDAWCQSLGAVVEPGELSERARARFRRSRRPQEIVDFARHLVDAGDDQGRVHELLEASASDQVRLWFDAEPERDLVLFVTALAFSANTSERAFERSLTALAGRFDDLKPASDDAEDLPPSGLNQTRRRRREGFPFVARDLPAEAGPSATSGVAFVSTEHRRAAISELWNRYDGELWDPTRDWLAECVGIGEAQRNLQIAQGLADLGRVDWHELETEYLNPWALGSHHQRATTCYAILIAGNDDACSSRALELVTRWAAKKSGPRTITAIACLSGSLGLRFPEEAVQWLWHLATKAGEHRAAANAGLALLFTEGASAGDRQLLEVPRLLLRAAGEHPVGAPSAKRTAALEVTAQILNVRHKRGRIALTALLVDQPTLRAPLGQLWSASLRSRPHRRRATLSLRDVLLGLDKKPAGNEVIRQLGRHIVNALPPLEAQLLAQELGPLLAAKAVGNQDQTRAILDTLLAAQPSEAEPQAELKEPSP